MSRGLALPALFFVLFLPYGTLIVVFRAFFTDSQTVVFAPQGGYRHGLTAPLPSMTALFTLFLLD